MTYEDLKNLHSKYFSLGYLNTKCGNKFVLVGLICYLTHKFKMEKPDVTPYKIIMQIDEGLSLPEDFAKSISVICEDFMYGCTEFPTFGVEEKDMISTIKNLLKTYMPF